MKRVALFLRIPAISPTTHACPTLQNTRCKSTFDCTLRGPFAKQCLTRFTASRALCVVLCGFISASTVYDESSIPLLSRFVNMFFEKVETMADIATRLILHLAMRQRNGAKRNQRHAHVSPPSHSCRLSPRYTRLGRRLA